MERFYPGIHQPGDAQHFVRCMISINRLRTRRKPVACMHVALDSGAFTMLEKYGCYPDPPEVYAADVLRLMAVLAGVDFVSSQDYMCEPFMLDKTGLSIDAHQRLTIERYDALRALLPGVPLLPVLQGYAPSEYVTHIRQYGERLGVGAWVGVGSVCKRNSDLGAIEAVLIAIKDARPDLRLHGFGVKTTALQSSIVRDCLHSADSMAWSFAARREGRNANDWREAVSFTERVERQTRTHRRHYQTSLWASLT